MNLLILSVGTRNKLVQYFKKELGSQGNVICTDMSEYAPALYEGDIYYLLPAIKDENYLERLLSICKKEQIDAVFSLIDPEISILLNNQSLLNNCGVKILHPNTEIVELSFDKYEFYKDLKSKGFKSQKTIIQDEIIQSLETHRLSYPVFVKPRTGSASININKINDKNSLLNTIQNNDDLIIQEYIDGIEYGIDVYIDYISKEVISIFIKRKIKMRAGETDKSISIKDKKIFEIIEDFVTKMGYTGAIDIDLFEANGTFYISEVNPRFGGGYPHAYLSGCNFPKYIINNLNGVSNDKAIGDYNEGNVMMKYSEIKYIQE